MARPDPKLFIVWSSKYKYIAEQVHDKLLDKRKTGFPVYPVMFNIGSGANLNKDIFTTLIDAMNSADFALILMTPDEEVLRRENGNIMGGFYATSRPNVYFEYGYLSKQLSTHKVFVYNTHGLITASDTSALITNYMKSPSNFDEIIKLPQTIAEDLEKHFNSKKEYYIDLDQESYEVDYKEVFHDITKDNAYSEFIINNSINLGKYWRYEINKFPKDSYHIGRKIIYILERMPFNIYLFASPKSTNTIEQPQKFIDVEVFSVLRKDIDAFLTAIDDPREYRNYKLYMTCLKLLEVIEKYQIKRNDSPAFSFSNKYTYSEEASTLFDLEEYITRFPLSQMLFNRYLALCLHKKTISTLNLEKLDFDFKKNIKKYFEKKDTGKEKNEDYFIAVMQTSMALTYINKTIELAEKYDSNNSIELHKSLALFDRARIEYLFYSLLEIESDRTNPALSFLVYMRTLLRDSKNNIDFIKKLAMEKTKKKLEKAFDYALIDFFDDVLNKQRINSKEISYKNQFKIKTIKLISDNIISAIFRVIDNKFKELGFKDCLKPHLSDDSKFGESEMENCLKSHPLDENKEIMEYINGVNRKWRDSTYDIVIFREPLLSKIYKKCDGQDKKGNGVDGGKGQDELEKEIIDCIKNRALELDIGNENIEIRILNTLNENHNLKQSVERICEIELDKMSKDLFNNLKDNIQMTERLGTRYKWEETMKHAETIRQNMWNATNDWPPNMRSILLFEYYHTLSDRYIYKISEIKSDLNSDIPEETCTNNDGTNLLIKKLKKNKEYELLNKLFTYYIFQMDYRGSCPQRYEYLKYLTKLAEIYVKLEHATGVMESNYEIPDLTRNILEKINKVLDSEKEFNI